MRTLFPGYFTPTAEEFTELWRDATFGFDANVLLGLYRLTPESRRVFFEVLKQIGDRIFLPNQAAEEYLRNRLEAISARSRSHQGLKAEAGKFVQAIEIKIQEHSLPEGDEIIEAARNAEKKIVLIVDSALKKEPDFFHADELRRELVALFEGKVGKPRDAFEESRKRAADRYARKIPPGYKDDNKTDDRKFGDAFIWFELLDLAQSTKKPVIFVTRDAKEDWWLVHEGRTFGPRPELAQEMKQHAGVPFYMYTTSRFLEFAQRHFGLKLEPTKKATTEIDEIERKDKEAAAQWATYNWSINSGPLNSTINSVPNQFATVAKDWNLNPFVVQPTTYFANAEEDAKAKNTYFQLLPIHGQSFSSQAGTWTCEIAETPGSVVIVDRASYKLRFASAGGIKTKQLTLWVSLGRLGGDLDWAYKKAIFRVISDWLGSAVGQAEIDVSVKSS
jgi:hypothetical protein